MEFETSDKKYILFNFILKEHSYVSAIVALFFK